MERDEAPPGLAIEIKGLRKAFGRTRVLAGLDLDVRWGEVLTVLGANGSGKTTLINLLSTLAKPDAGVLRVAGLNLSRSGQAARRAIGVVTHDPILYDHLSAYENLKFVGRMFGLGSLDQRIGAVAELMGVSRQLHQRAHTLSHGMKKRVSIARALLHDPPILLMDEPDSGLDQEALALLDGVLAGRSGPRTVLMTTHSLDRSLALGQRVAILAQRQGCPRRGPRLGRRRASEEDLQPLHGGSRWLASSARWPPFSGKTPCWSSGQRTPSSPCLTFALLAIVVFSFAIEPTPRMVALVAPGILWIAFAFGGVLGLTRSFALEKDAGNLRALMLAPIGRDAVFFGKMLGNFVFMLIVELMAFPAFVVLFDLPIAMAGLIPVALLATLGVAAVGTLFSAMAVNTRSREVMLPLLFLPAALPLIVAAVEATGVVIGGSGAGGLVQWLTLLAVFDAVFLVVCPVAFTLVIEE